jgi:hypothetical protein
MQVSIPFRRKWTCSNWSLWSRVLVEPPAVGQWPLPSTQVTPTAPPSVVDSICPPYTFGFSLDFHKSYHWTACYYSEWKDRILQWPMPNPTFSVNASPKIDPNASMSASQRNHISSTHTGRSFLPGLNERSGKKGLVTTRTVSYKAPLLTRYLSYSL